eukprot:4515859-Pyramimonas_sp.AAC.1
MVPLRVAWTVSRLPRRILVPAGVPGRFQDPPRAPWWFLVDSMIPFVAPGMFEGSTNRSVVP